MKRVESHIFQGMQRDVSISKQQPQFLWDAENIRLTAREGDTLMSVTNERGSEETDVALTGSYMGHCVLGNYLTIFTTGDKDYIYRITKNSDGSFSTKQLYGINTRQESLGFDPEHPLQTLGIYENEKIQKVYWTDGINQPRVINIVKDIYNEGAEDYYINTSFDFVPEMKLNDSIKIQKLSDSNGSFAAGVIQYAVTYYNKYGQQSNISCVSPLIPISFFSRAGSPEEKVSNSFRIIVNSPDTSFEYLRLYSIQRTSLNGTPICRRVEDIRLGNGGSSGDATYELIAIGKIERGFAVRVNSFGSISISNAASDATTQYILSSSQIEGGVELPGISGTHRCYHLTKDQMPYLSICISETGYDTYVTWGDATDIYITENEVDSATYGSGYYIVGMKDDKAANLIYLNSRRPIVYKKIEKVSNVTIVDNGIIGETVDPQELLYIGGEDITAETIESKDGTLFFGNIRLNQAPIDDIKTEIKGTINSNTTNNNISQGVRTTNRPVALNGSNYKWGNSLNAKDDEGYATNPAGLKFGEHYRLGVQFQYKNGKWSEPVYIKDDCITSIDYKPNLTETEDIEKYNIPRFVGNLQNTDNNIVTTLINRGYKRVRGVIVFPTASDRLILAQGILNPTVASVTAHAQHSPDYQSSWFFRPWINTTANNNNNGWPVNNDDSIMEGAIIEWRHRKLLFGFNDRGSEIQGLPEEYKSWTMKSNVDKIDYNIPGYGGGDGRIQVDSGKRTGGDPWKKIVHVDDDMMDTAFYVNQQYVTMHSPEFEFNDSLKNLDFIDVKLRKRGYVTFTRNVGDILIETSSPPIGKESTGFVHKSLSWSTSRCRRLCAGIFYNDWLVDDNNKYEQWSSQGYEYGFMVYPWHKSGSLNNDCNRPANEGTRSAVLKRKIISNILYARQSFTREYGSSSLAIDTPPQMFDVDQVGLVKIDGQNYYGNIDTLLTPMATYGTLISIGGNNNDKGNLGSDADDNLHIKNIFTSKSAYFWKGTLHDFERIDLVSSDSDWSGDHGNGWDSRVGNDNRSLRTSKESIRMKYKSTPHLLFKLSNDLSAPTEGKNTTPGQEDTDPVYNSLHFVELYREANSATDFGGEDDDALQANVWVPAGEAVTLKTSGTTTFYYDWGDTWYQRYDCLKTYPFTHEDENQIVEIGSFMVETHVNIDGRYDRNRGQDSNLYVDPENFNLINLVYSQLDNFFNYKIMDSDFYKLNSFPATVAWTLQKNNASEVDAWTNITLGNTLDMDGNAGKVTSVNTSMDTLYCFQERGVSQIMFNSRVQIPASDGVPIELSNSYKVNGSHYISNTIGCPNKFAIAKSPMGLYFVDGVGSTLYLLQGNQMQNISDNHGMGYWFSQQDTQNAWVPHSYGRNGKGMRLCYDNVNGDLYIMPEQGKALCYSDQLQQFVSFYDYYACGLFNIGNSVHALTNEEEQNITVSLHNLFIGEYNKLLGTYYPSSITFVSNADMQLDKIFTNLELRADFYKGDELQHMHFFDTIRAWNEYQDTDWIDEHGNLNTTSLKHKYFPYGMGNTSIASNVKKKFRIWRVDIPRAKKWVAYTEEEKQAMIDSGKYTVDTVPAGHLINVNDRIRNTWCKIKLTMNVPPQELEGYEPYRMEMHDTSVIYYI